MVRQVKHLYYVRFDSLFKKTREGETPMLTHAIIAESLNEAITKAESIGIGPKMISRHQLNKDW